MSVPAIAKRVVLHAARQFARSLAESMAFENLERAQQRLAADQAGMRAVREFQRFQERLGWLLQQGLVSPEDKAELARLEQVTLSHEAVKSYLDAQTEFARLCQSSASLVSSIIGMNLVGGCACGSASGQSSSGAKDGVLDKTMEKAAKELAERLNQSTRMKALSVAKERLDQDRHAQSIIRDLEDAQTEFLESYGEGQEASREVIENIKKLQERLQANPSFVAYARAQREAQELLSKVVEEVSGLLGVDFGVLARSVTC